MLPEFPSTSVNVSSEAACENEVEFTYYFASLTGVAIINVFDYVFSDANGQYALADGFYRTNISGPSQWIQVDNGIVIAIGNC